MRITDGFFVTRREFPKDEDALVAKLLIKSGMIIKNNSGIYSYLPLGLKVLENIKKIIKEEVNKINASEVLLPSIINSEVFDITGREKIFDNEMYNIIDRNNKKMILCSTSEELFAYLVSFKINSYKDLHFSLYQISNKFRDEKHPELGLIRKKEFYMFDAYSFDADEGGMDVSYDKMYLAFKNIFNKLSLETLTVDSDATILNGVSSEEFQVISDHGDNEIVKCSNCTYACDLQDACSRTITTNREVNHKVKQLIHTPNIKSIKDVSEYLNIFPSNILKSLICKVDNKYKMVLLRGESELNVKKLKKLFNTPNIEIPTSYELSMLGINTGYIGPIDSDIEIIADNEVKCMHNFVCGSNKENYHFINVNYGRDFKINRFADLKLFDKNSLCPKCKSKCNIIKGIEIAQIYKIGSNYSKLYNLTYTDEVNKEQFVHMGSYQIGLDRCLSAIVEKYHDDKGIIWPLSISPYKVAIVVSNVNDEDSVKFANVLHDKLIKMNIDTILDDRKESIGVKFNDMDLIGIPLRITIGKKLYTDSSVELKLRSEEKVEDIKVSKIIDVILGLIESNI